MTQNIYLCISWVPLRGKRGGALLKMTGGHDAQLSSASLLHQLTEELRQAAPAQ